MNDIRNLNLKPCPFCGRVPVLDEAGFEHNLLSRLSLRCEHCFTKFEIEVPSYYADGLSIDLYDPVEIWNSRVEK